ncbi:hypothetical protein HYH03_017592 [Edaphochlamys debaryana]|uniref:Serine-threonine/tyrosine-protein kinase catalytic domain-containing protein n=1 Tax=Edaphochlamys debaryana TaxID=47281 RepID=A0A836BQF1_9CHLO|nr:hypothetical protein HYH03_017592 [Edaphochlamys debaryana]|eukprot:KAG2483538.1 hypothetical protein HYH03_017592 [Edaphochlamys debaryana]
MRVAPIFRQRGTTGALALACSGLLLSMTAEGGSLAALQARFEAWARLGLSPYRRALLAARRAAAQPKGPPEGPGSWEAEGGQGRGAEDLRVEGPTRPEELGQGGLVQARLVSGNEQEAAEEDGIVAAAVGSPGPDWKAKALWLMAQGLRLRGSSGGDGAPSAAPALAAAQPEGEARLRWLARVAGVAVATRDAATAAARYGNLGALSYILDDMAAPPAPGLAALGPGVAEAAAAAGQLQALRLLAARGAPLEPWGLLLAAARRGDVGMLRWLAEVWPDALTAALAEPELAVAAARSGSVATLSWLVEEHGMSLQGGGGGGGGDGGGGGVLAGAAGSGCAAAVEWVAAHGAPLEDGAPYLAAGRHGDLSVLAVLRRLGCPWTADTFTDAVHDSATWGCRLAVLRWMADEGCPIDWRGAARRARRRRPGGEEGPEVVAWVVHVSSLARAPAHDNLLRCFAYLHASLDDLQQALSSSRNWGTEWHDSLVAPPGPDFPAPAGPDCPAPAGPAPGHVHGPRCLAEARGSLQGALEALAAVAEEGQRLQVLVTECCDGGDLHSLLLRLRRHTPGQGQQQGQGKVEGQAEGAWAPQPISPVGAPLQPACAGVAPDRSCPPRPGPGPGLNRLAAVQAALDVARGVAALHAAGLTHGRLEPRTVLCASTPDVRAARQGAAEQQGGAQRRLLDGIAKPRPLAVPKLMGEVERGGGGGGGGGGDAGGGGGHQDSVWRPVGLGLMPPGQAAAAGRAGGGRGTSLEGPWGSEGRSRGALGGVRAAVTRHSYSAGMAAAATTAAAAAAAAAAGTGSPPSAPRSLGPAPSLGSVTSLAGASSAAFAAAAAVVVAHRGAPAPSAHRVSMCDAAFSPAATTSLPTATTGATLLWVPDGTSRLLSAYSSGLNVSLQPTSRLSLHPPMRSASERPTTAGGGALWEPLALHFPSPPPSEGNLSTAIDAVARGAFEPSLGIASSSQQPRDCSAVPPAPTAVHAPGLTAPALGERALSPSPGPGPEPGACPAPRPWVLKVSLPGMAPSGGSGQGPGLEAGAAGGALARHTCAWPALAYMAPEAAAALAGWAAAGPGMAGAEEQAPPSGAAGGGPGSVEGATGPGSPGAAAPPVGPAADVYSLGALLWQLVSGGRPPHYERHPAQILMGLLSGDLDLALEWPEDVDPELAELGRACMRREPDSRPSAQEVVAALEGVLGRMGCPPAKD